MQESFFVVWNPDHGLPKFKHSTRASTVTEAKRLAGAHPGQEFFVLGSIGSAQTADPVQWCDHAEMPF